MIILKSHHLLKILKCIAYRNFVNQATTMKNSVILNPWFLTGFADAESCFTLSIYRDDTKTMGWRVQVIFTIELHEKDISLLEMIKNTFGGAGKIYSPRMGSKQYRVTSIKELQVIINHFDKYPLITKKRTDYELFKVAISLIDNKEHLISEGLDKLVSIRAAMNLGLTDALKTAFPNVIPFSKIDLWESDIKDPNWLAGFSSGEGCFFINIIKSKTSKLGETVQLNFNITQHSRDELLIKSLVEYFGCGKVYLHPDKVSFNISSLSELNSKLAPFFEKYPIRGVKFLDYMDFLKVIRLMIDKVHLTSEGLDLIREIKSGMNRNR